MQALTANIQELAWQSATDCREMQELTRQNQELIALLRSRGEIQIPNPGQGQNDGERETRIKINMMKGASPIRTGYPIRVKWQSPPGPLQMLGPLGWRKCWIK